MSSFILNCPIRLFPCLSCSDSLFLFTEQSDCLDNVRQVNEREFVDTTVIWLGLVFVENYAAIVKSIVSQMFNTVFVNDDVKTLIGSVCYTLIELVVPVFIVNAFKGFTVDSVVLIEPATAIIEEIPYLSDSALSFASFIKPKFVDFVISNIVAMLIDKLLLCPPYRLFYLLSISLALMISGLILSQNRW